MAERSISEVIAQLARMESAISDALGNEVAHEAKNCIREAALSEVYSYTPEFESRRMGNGGLIDENNMVDSVTGTTLTVQNVTPLQNLWGGTHTEPLTPIIEDGLPNYNMPYPRPFMDKAKETLLNGRAEEALRMGLARQGIDTSGLAFEFD